MGERMGNITNMEGANLKGVLFDNSQMNGLNLRLASLKGAFLRSCNLRYAIMAGTDLEVMFEHPHPAILALRFSVTSRCEKKKNVHHLLYVLFTLIHPLTQHIHTLTHPPSNFSPLTHSLLFNQELFTTTLGGGGGGDRAGLGMAKQSLLSVFLTVVIV